MISDHRLSKLDRFSWALRLIGAAYLVLFTSWFTSDADLIAKSASNGIFHDQAQPLSSTFQSFFFVLGISSSIILIASRLLKLALSLCVISLIALLGQLPHELLQNTDRFLVALSLLIIVTPSQRNDLSTSIRVYALSALLAVWAWTNLYFVYLQPSPIWTRHYFLNYWAWTDAAPTPMALTLASSSNWLKKFVSLTLLSSFAFAPIIILLKVRLWPVLWLCSVLILSIGQELPSWIALTITLGLFVICDQRWRNGLDQKLSKRLPLQYLSSLAMLRWPTLLLTAWLTLSSHSGITALLVISMYLLCSSLHLAPHTKPNTEKKAFEEEVSPFSKGNAISVILATVILVVFSLNVLGFDNAVRKNIPQVSPWLWSQADAHWTISPRERSSLIIERSENGGATWLKEDHVALDRVTLENQPWRPFHPLREEHWFHQIAESDECLEGPFMELFERRLKFHVKRLNTPPLQTDHQMILMRARRVHWVRSSYRFWREEAKGFFCIATNLPVLLKARAMVQKAQDALPTMPSLDPSQKVK